MHTGGIPHHGMSCPVYKQGGVGQEVPPLPHLRNSSIFSGRDEPTRKLLCRLAGSLQPHAALGASFRKGLSCRIATSVQKHAEACGYALRICRRGSHNLSNLKCKGRGMQEGLFSIPVATHTPGALPPPVRADGAAFRVHCWLPTQLLSAGYPLCWQRKGNPNHFPAHFLLPQASEIQGGDFLLFPSSLFCSSALEHLREHCWEMGWCPLPMGDASSSAKGFPSQEGNAC